MQHQTAIISALVEGCSIRATARLVGAHRDTVMRLGARIGHACTYLHELFFQRLNISVIEVDELWSFVAKKQRRLRPDDDTDFGDQYVFVALDAVGKAIISYRVGKRDGDAALDFVADLRQRVLGSPIVSSDSFPGYADAFRTAFGHSAHYGQVIKRFEAQPPEERERGEPRETIVWQRKEAVIGNPPAFLTSTSLVERSNLTMRMHCRRFTRRTNAFSKCFLNHCAAVSLQIAFYNFVRTHETIRTAPAVHLGLTDRPWSIAELIEAANFAKSRLAA
jgi:IS1 family transposase